MSRKLTIIIEDKDQSKAINIQDDNDMKICLETMIDPETYKDVYELGKELLKKLSQINV